MQDAPASYIFDGIDDFIAGVNATLDSVGIGPQEVTVLDHVCYRTESVDEYQRVRRDAMLLGDLLGDILVHGRPISTIALSEPLSVGGWLVPYLEIPSPKPGVEYTSGLEHAEFVVLGELRTFCKRHPEVGFGDEGLQDPLNPELTCPILGADGIIKFHQQSLGSLIYIGNSLGLAEHAS